MKQSAALVLEDGRVFEGWMLSEAQDSRGGEVCFNTSMTGYEEILTDPSYAGQTVCFTTPHIGNYGISPLDMESKRSWVHGVVARDFTQDPCNYRAEESLLGFLTTQGVPALFGVDTRALTKHLRDQGAKRGLITRKGKDAALSQLRTEPAYDDVDWVSQVATREPYAWAQGLEWGTPDAPSVHLRMRADASAPSPAGRRVTVLDCGVKLNILRSLVSVGCTVTVVPPNTSAETILKSKPDGIVLSNGPGDPAKLPSVIATVKSLLGTVPILGICLGHQMLALALGLQTYKLKFGHRGGNHPVMNLVTKHVEMTAQNHGFAVDMNEGRTTHAADLKLTHVNLNDKTCEGFASAASRFLSVQYHPEAAPGPLDAHSVFLDFVTLMEG
jgi:carbamoyl-phosphate synthase small subunit